MMRTKLYTALALAVFAVACKPATPAAQDTAAQTVPAQAAAASSSEAPDQPPIERDFQKEMSYADLRSRLLASGWLPLRNPECWDRLPDRSALCNHLPEVEACRDGGQCDMRFANVEASEVLTVSAQGRYERWNAPGETSSVMVKDWERTARPGAASESPSVTCPSQDFETFLKAYAAETDVRASFTAPLVEVAELETDDDDGFYVAQEGYHPRSVYVLGKDYKGFNVAYRNGTFHYVDDNGELDPESLDVKIEQASQEVYLVRYVYGMSEGNSYQFQTKGGCWYLVEDQDPPTP